MNPANMMPTSNPQPPSKKKRRTSEQVIKNITVNRAKKNQEELLIKKIRCMITRDIGLIGITKTRIAKVDNDIIILKENKQLHQQKLKNLRFRKKSNKEKLELLEKRQTAAEVVLEAVASSSSVSSNSSDSSD